MWLNNSVSRKTVSDSQKKQILDRFNNGSTIKDIADDFQFTIPTITRQLKNILGEEEFKKTKTKTLLKSSENKINEKNISELDIRVKNSEEKDYQEETEDFSNNSFFEIAPLDFEVDLEKQRDISSKPINSVDLPNVVFIIVDSNIELQPKLLKDYAFWSFLPEKDLSRKILEIFSEQRSAKKFCSKNQKIIKVPNPNVFLIASEILKRKGISRIIFDQLLLSL